MHVIAALAALGIGITIVLGGLPRVLIVGGALLGVIAMNYNGRLVDIVYAKGMRRDRAWMLFARWNAISRVEVNQVGDSKYIVIDASQELTPPKSLSRVAAEKSPTVGRAFLNAEC